MTIPFISEIVYHHHILIILNAAIISKKPRSRHCSLIENSETEKRKMRHMSMQDRIEMYNNRDLEDQQMGEPVTVGQDTERVRKTSRVMFNVPIASAAVCDTAARLECAFRFSLQGFHSIMDIGSSIPSSRAAFVAI